MYNTTKHLLACLTFLFIAISPGRAQSGSLIELATISNVSPAFGIAVKGDYLYANPGNAEIKVFNIANPTAPVSMNSVNYQGYFADKMNVHGDYLYLFGGPTNILRIFEITNPAAPTAVGSATLSSPNNVVFAAHSNDYTYVTTGDKLFTVNTSNKNNPVLQNTLTEANAGTYGLRNIAVSQNHLYVGVASGVFIHNISSPGAPVYAGSVATGFLSLTLDEPGQRLISGMQSGNGHHVNNIANAAAPSFLFSGMGGTTTGGGQLCYANGILLQAGPDIGTQSVNVFRIGASSSTWVQEFNGSMNYAITEIKAKDSLFFVSKHGGIEILGAGTLVGKTEQILMDGVKVCPVPASNRLRVRCDALPGLVDMVVTDLQGKELIRSQAVPGDAEIDISSLSQGLYLLSVYHESGRIGMQKFTVEK